MKKYNLVKENLTEAQKITLAFQGDFGGIVAIQALYIRCEIAPHYANCDESLNGVKLIFKQKSKRTASCKTISYNVPLVIYNDWLEIDADTILYEDKGDGIKEGKYLAHDNQYFYDLIEKYPDNIIFSDIE